LARARRHQLQPATRRRHPGQPHLRQSSPRHPARRPHQHRRPHRPPQLRPPHHASPRRLAPRARVDPSWLRLVRTSAAADDGFEAFGGGRRGGGLQRVPVRTWSSGGPIPGTGA